jgi:hypothetical protein
MKQMEWDHNISYLEFWIFNDLLVGDSRNEAVRCTGD